MSITVSGMKNILVEGPLISCLCVTHLKPDMLRRTIRCFLYQSYQNRQLIVVYEDHDRPTVAFIDSIPPDRRIQFIKVESRNGKKSLGELRNISYAYAQGEFVCQWDDDDWYHQDRLYHQLSALSALQGSASILGRWIIWDNDHQKAYLSHERLWEGSILCRKSLIESTPYPHIEKGEDTAVIEWLDKGGHLSSIKNMPHLYVYVFHGENTWSREHFTKIFQASYEFDADDSLTISKIVNNDSPSAEDSKLLETISRKYRAASLV
jgi:glycosyltransferase involved in cell wall biosynthesis